MHTFFAFRSSQYFFVSANAASNFSADGEKADTFGWAAVEPQRSSKTFSGTQAAADSWRAAPSTWLFLLPQQNRWLLEGTLSIASNAQLSPSDAVSGQRRGHMVAKVRERTHR